MGCGFALVIGPPVAPFIWNSYVMIGKDYFSQKTDRFDKFLVKKRYNFEEHINQIDQILPCIKNLTPMFAPIYKWNLDVSKKVLVIFLI